MTTIESIPQVWDDERDEMYFRITASLFTPSYCYGASVLLASYDLDEAVRSTVVASRVPMASAPVPSTAGLRIGQA